MQEEGVLSNKNHSNECRISACIKLWTATTVRCLCCSYCDFSLLAVFLQIPSMRIVRAELCPSVLYSTEHISPIYAIIAKPANYNNNDKRSGKQPDVLRAQSAHKRYIYARTYSTRETADAAMRLWAMLAIALTERQKQHRLSAYSARARAHTARRAADEMSRKSERCTK